MLNFFTFAVDIKRHSQSDLKKCLNILFYSMKTHIKCNFQMIVFTNFKNDISNDYINDVNVVFREYYDKGQYKLYSDKWLNLSFNKINIYKDLYDEFKKDFIWIDLDTIVTYDISYLKDLNNFFTQHGGKDITKSLIFQNDTTFFLPIHKSLQGNFWKLNIKLYKEFIKTLEIILEKKLLLYYDLQNLFNYHIFFIDHTSSEYNILGSNIKNDALFGMTVWSKTHLHPNIDGMRLLYKDNYNILRTYHEPEKEIHILTFTFNTIKKLWNTNRFQELFPSNL